MNFLGKIRAELSSFSKSEKLFVLGAMLCCFLITVEYAIVRPVCNSVFIHAYGASIFPYAWLAIIPLNLGVVYLYNRFLPKLGSLRMFLTILGIVMGGNLACAFLLKEFHALPFIFYIWKEVYIVLMFQQLWSIINTTIPMTRAKYLFGFVAAAGGLGGTAGSFIPSCLAVKMGSESLLFACPLIYAFLALAYMAMFKNSAIAQEIPVEKKPDFSEGFKMIRNSQFLGFILFIVVFMQLGATLVDYQFHTLLEHEFPDKDLRTEYAGKVLGIVNFLTMGLQLVGTFLVVQLLGLKRAHLFVPATFLCNAVGFAIFPIFGMASFSYITVKSFDFSLFGVIKEMLYIPLKLDEKFRAKAIIDVFAYRSAKALGSLLILGISLFPSPLDLLNWGNMLVFVVWGAVVIRLFKYHQVDKIAAPL
jgi:AAA family ATP:ADP antiporter